MKKLFLFWKLNQAYYQNNVDINNFEFSWFFQSHHQPLIIYIFPVSLAEPRNNGQIQHLANKQKAWGEKFVFIQW